jgi:hypothetical protein
MPIDRVESVMIRVTTTSGDTYEWEFSPREYDLVFFSQGAFERFLMPYYVGRSGIDYAHEMADSMEASFARGVR